LMCRPAIKQLRFDSFHLYKVQWILNLRIKLHLYRGVANKKNPDPASAGSGLTVKSQIIN
jgi:hypothetical protein